MTVHCAPMCHTCHLIDFDTRCPRKPDAVDAFHKGDLNKMFERIVGEANGGDNDDAVYDFEIHSRPRRAGDDIDTLDYHVGPWIITIDNFLSDEECAKLIELGGLEGYERSEDVGPEKFDGTFESVQSSSRTSHNAWCSNDCLTHPTSVGVMEKIEKLTGVPETNSEHLQLLRYHEGQFYRTHHDYIGETSEKPPGPRILTAFLYLNDVTEGGGTNFPTLGPKPGITVFPKKGRILLWPSVKDENPMRKDFRTSHQALSVDKGIKYAANAWIHMRDFKEPHERGCT
jgi:prolyl 4-hydroxylase